MFTHVGHCKLKQTQVVGGVGDLSTEYFQKISKLMQNHCAASETRQFLQFPTGGRLPPNSIAKLCTHALMQNFDCDGLETTVKNLNRLIEENDGMLHVICTGSCHETSNLVKMHKRVKILSKN